MAVSRLGQKIESELGGLNHGYGAILLVIILIIAGIFWWQLPPEIPLFYGLPYGSSQLADRGWFLLLPIISMVIFGVSQFLMRLSLKSKLFSPMIGWLQTLYLFLIALAMTHIILVAL
jgi:hypothetical protein